MAAKKRAQRSLTKAELQSLASVLVDRAAFATRAGITHGGKRDLYTALGYPRNLQFNDYSEQYQRGDIAQRIVNCYPQATWAGEVQVQEDPDPEVETKFEKAATDLLKRLNAWDYLQRADILCGIGLYSVILIGAPGDLATPLKRVASGDRIAFLNALDEDRATIVKIDEDASSPRFGLPEFYELKIGSTPNNLSTGGNDQTAARKAVRVHWTRVIHVVEGCLVDDVYGEPRLRSVWNRLMDLDKIYGGGSEAAWKRMDQGLQIEMDPNVEFLPEDKAALSTQVDDFLHGARRTLNTRGVKINPLSATVTAFGSNADSLIQVIAGAKGIPQRILMGSEMGELASTQDRSNWSDRVMERRRSFGVPTARKLIDRFISIGALPAPGASGYEIVWPEIEEQSEQEKATILAALASANSAQMTSEKRIVISADEMRNRVLGLDKLDTVIKPGEPGNNEEPPEAAVPPPGAPGRSVGDPGEPAPPPGEGGAVPEKGVKANSAANFRPAVQVPAVMRAAASAETKAVRRAADAQATKAKTIVRRAFLQGRLIVNIPRLEKALSLRDVQAAQHILEDGVFSANARLTAWLPNHYAATMKASADAALAAAKSRGSWLRRLMDAIGDEPRTEFRATATAKITTRFDIKEPRVQEWAKARTAELVKEIDEPTKKAIRELITKGFEQGIAPAPLAKELVDVIGLRSDQLAILDKLSEAGASDTEIADRALELLDDRAELIARTESARAANEGQVELWRQAVDNEELPRNAMRVWIGTDDGRERDSHVFMNGQVVGLDEPFIDENGDPLEPGEEPYCRCSQAIATDEDIAEYADQEEAA